MGAPKEVEATLLTVDEVAKYLKVSRAFAYTMANDGTLPVVRFGRSIRVPKARLDRWIEDHSR